MGNKAYSGDSTDESRLRSKAGFRMKQIASIVERLTNSSFARSEIYAAPSEILAPGGSGQSLRVSRSIEMVRQRESEQAYSPQIRLNSVCGSSKDVIALK